MDLGDIDSSLKVLLIGAEGVGKTSLTSVFCGRSLPVQHKKTIGTAFKEKDLYLPETGDDINLMIWEIGGEHAFVPMNGRHFKDADAVVIMFATDDLASFERVKDYQAKVAKECRPGTLVVIVQNKIDLLDSAAMSNPEVERLARELCVKLYRISCSDLVIVEQVFHYLAAKLTASGTIGGNLADIGDVIPTLDEVDPPAPPSEEKEGSPNIINESNGTGIPGKDKGKFVEVIDDGEGTENRQTVVFPRNEVTTATAPSVPSKQRTLGSRRRKSCIIM